MKSRTPIAPRAAPVSRAGAAAAAPARADDAPNLGAALRRLRFQRRLSIAEVSQATGIAKSTLSRVENDQLSLTYSKLLQLCRGLDIDIAELFSGPQAAAAAPPLARRTFTLPGAGRPVDVGRQAYAYLCTELAGKKMTPMTGIITSRSLAESNGLLSHEGEEFTYVLEGRLELHTEFYSPLVLEAGGSVYFDSTMGHAYVSVGSVPLKILCVCSTPEHVIEHALHPDAAAPQERALEDFRPAPARRAPRRRAPGRGA
ncbi:MAG: helix-turn-helix transcriptional regulator [Proteobacteria bacterium]|nr:helix-turn-helix transcriptional regulator [Pseudomonadota bacterium]